MDKNHDCVILSSLKIENCLWQRKRFHPYFRQINGNPGNSSNAKAPDPTSESEGAVAELGKPFLATLYRSGRPAPQQQSRLVRVWRQQVLLHIIWCTSLGNTTIGSNRDGNSSKAETGDCSRTSPVPKNEQWLGTVQLRLTKQNSSYLWRHPGHPALGAQPSAQLLFEGLKLGLWSQCSWKPNLGNTCCAAGEVLSFVDMIYLKDDGCA